MKAIEFIPRYTENANIPKFIHKKEPVWQGCATILKDMIERFQIKTDTALDLGVLFGYSTSALAKYFKQVTGVDTFKNDRYENDPTRESNIEDVRLWLKKYKNITLVESMWKDFVKIEPDKRYDLVHVDMIHDYKNTLEPVEWAINHSDFVIVHDTEPYPEVMRACEELSDKYNLQFYNYKWSFGLGMLFK